MSTIAPSGRFSALSDERTIAETATALEEHGFSVDVVEDLDATRETVLARTLRDRPR